MLPKFLDVVIIFLCPLLVVAEDASIFKFGRYFVFAILMLWDLYLWLLKQTSTVLIPTVVTDHRRSFQDLLWRFMNLLNFVV